MDQIPVLTDLLRALEELAIMNVGSSLSTNPFVVQQVIILVF